MRFDVVFLDPPYEAVDEYATALGCWAGGVGSAGGGCGGDRGASAQREAGRCDMVCLRRTRVLEQGDAALSFYEAAISS